MAHKKAGGSTRNGRDSESKRLGVKAFGGQAVSCLLYTSPSPRDVEESRMPSSA